MNRALIWRGVLILAVVGLSIAAAYPLHEKINLGLDLRGGMHLVLQVETDDALRAEADKDLERLVQEAREAGATAIQPLPERPTPTSFAVGGVDPGQDAVIAKVANDFLPGWDWERRGDRLVFDMTMVNATEIRRQAVSQALTTIDNRVNALGVAEPVIAQQGAAGNRIVVQLPGVDDPDRVKDIIGKVAFLEFRLVDYPTGGNLGAGSREELLARYNGALPSHLEILESDERDARGRVVGQRYYAVEKRRVITGRDLKTARPGLGQFNQPIVNFSLTHEGGERFGEATGANVGKGLAIVLDGKVMSAPRINSRITDSGLIEGSFTQEEVEDLSTVLRSGALPAGITYLEERTVGPSLGQDSIDRGLKAGLLGAALTVLMMLVIYKGAGVNAVLALVLNMVILFGALAYFDATLTLPGIAGIVLTLGMAVDANVLIFERIKEELRLGRTVKSAIDAGFEKALSSIVDGNLTTLIAALFLFQFGTGPVRGFAVTLSIGILASMFTAVFVSRWLFNLLLARRTRVERLSI
jgi:preprotein translocase subunit SecD